MADDYPAFRGPRVSIADALREGGGSVAGRLLDADEVLRLSDAPDVDGLVLADETATVVVTEINGQSVSSGDWVSGRLALRKGAGFRLESAAIHAARRLPSPDPYLSAKLAVLRARADVFAAARTFFRERGFLEVDTPARVVCPGLEPHLSAYPAGDGRWLITSPELHLKRLLAAGTERVVEFARAFRDDERGRWHRPEFTLLEWYRAFETLETIEADCEQLLRACARAAGLDERLSLGVCDLTPPFERVTVRDLLRERTGLDWVELQDRDAFARAAGSLGHIVGADDPWDEIFFRVWSSEVEPQLGLARPVFVHDYPASQAALARTRGVGWGAVAERFELYVAGVELANAFHELNDPAEQRRRHEADRADRRAAGRPVYPLDERFLAALESGMPPAVGIALGLDRLAALLVGADGLDAITAFP